MIDLDMNTVTLMTIFFSGVLSFLLLAAKANTQKIYGAGYWALSNLLVCMGLVISLFQLSYEVYGLTLIAVLMASGFGLNVIGILKFKKGHLNVTRVMTFFIVFVAITNMIGVFLGWGICVAMAFNIMFLAFYDMTLAYMLILKKDESLNYWAWINATIFFVVGSFTLFKGLGLILGYAPHIKILAFLAKCEIETIIVLVCAIKQMCIMISFIMMMHHKRLQSLHELAMFDHLTGAFNRRGLIEAAEAMSANCERFKFDMSMIALDLDKFKSINDRFGHATGDEVLKSFADSVKQSIRAGDLFGRYGGEEFCVLMPDASESDADALANRIREHFASREMMYGGKNQSFTVSAGVSCSVQVGFDFKGLWAAADSALYTAKKMGRNRVVTHSSVSLHPDKF